jgi:hypothetical protein
MQDKKAFQDMQRDFATRYPFLKIDFFKSLGAPGQQAFPMGGLPVANRRQQWWMGKMEARDISLEGQRTVAQLVKDIEEEFAQTVMILRRAGNVWIETSLTTYWTLEQQNREGEHISRLS